MEQARHAPGITRMTVMRPAKLTTAKENSMRKSIYLWGRAAAIVLPLLGSPIIAHAAANNGGSIHLAQTMGQPGGGPTGSSGNSGVSDYNSGTAGTEMNDNNGPASSTSSPSSSTSHHRRHHSGKSDVNSSSTYRNRSSDSK